MLKAMGTIKQKKKILIIDDEKDLSELLKWNLEREGYQVLAAFDGEAGLAVANSENPDLLLLDINMPKMGGIQVYQHLTNSYGRTRIPVIVFTTREELEDTFRDIDADAFLPKPFEMNVLLAHIESILKKETETEVYLADLKENPHVQELQKALTDERFKVTFVDDIGFIKVRSAARAPDCILMEYMQRDISGDEFIRGIRSIPGLSKVPLLVYSYSGFEELREKALHAGADEYLGKPENPHVIISAVRKYELKAKEKKS